IRSASTRGRDRWRGQGRGSCQPLLSPGRRLYQKVVFLSSDHSIDSGRGESMRLLILLPASIAVRASGAETPIRSVRGPVFVVDANRTDTSFRSPNRASPKRRGVHSPGMGVMAETCIALPGSSP